MPKKSKGKKIKFYVVSCSCAGNSDMRTLGGYTFDEKREAQKFMDECAENPCTMGCDAQIHKCEVVRKG